MCGALLSGMTFLLLLDMTFFVIELVFLTFLFPNFVMFWISPFRLRQYYHLYDKHLCYKCLINMFIQIGCKCCHKIKVILFALLFLGWFKWCIGYTLRTSIWCKGISHVGNLSTKLLHYIFYFFHHYINSLVLYRTHSSVTSSIS